MEEALHTFMNAFGSGYRECGESIFDSFFGFDTNAKNSGTRQGASKKMNLTISFEESIRGVEKEVSISNYESCSACHGSGAASPSDVKVCAQCSGSGHVHQAHGFFSMTTVCGSCNGNGKVVTEVCKSCRGSGREKKKQILKIRVPSGVDSGMRLRMTGYGDVGEGGGSRGDLYVYISVQPHEIFKREENDIIIEIPITFTEAALGVKKEIPTPTTGGRSRIKIPEGTQNGKIFRIRGEGAPNVHDGGPGGDLLVVILIETPVGLNGEQKKLFKMLQDLEGDHNSPRKRTFLDKAKSLFS